MAFQCKHCGKCCTDPLIPINLTLGDIYRFSKVLNQPIEKLFPNFINILPFRGLDPTIYTPDFGLNKPCPKRTDQCEIYPARPLNCRIFPYWLLGIKDAWPNTPCTKDLKLTQEDLKIYKQYKDTLGNIILEEDKITEKFLKQFFQDIDISKSPNFPNKDNTHQQELKKIQLAQSQIIIPNNFIQELKKEINQHQNFFEKNYQLIKQAEDLFHGHT